MVHSFALGTALEEELFPDFTKGSGEERGLWVKLMGSGVGDFAW